MVSIHIEMLEHLSDSTRAVKIVCNFYQYANIQICIQPGQRIVDFLDHLEKLELLKWQNEFYDCL